MASGFVSGGTIDEPAERDEEWRQAQEELNEERRRKAEMGRQEGGKSLYEVLEQNKMAKREAFEESIRLKHQFRALDEDEVEFLDSLLESTRAKEAAVKKETAEQLAAFHRQREQADRALLESTSGENAKASGQPGSPVEEEQWTTSGRKRKRNQKLPFARNLRNPSITHRNPTSLGGGTGSEMEATDTCNTAEAATTSPPPAPTSPSLRLASVLESPPSSQKRPSPPSKSQASGKVSPKAAPVSLGLGAYSSSEE